MPLIGTRLQSNEIEQLDKIAAAAQVPRAVIIRWALRDYVQRLLLSPRPAQETLYGSNVSASVPDVAAYARPMELHLFPPHSNDVDDGGPAASSDAVFAHKVFDATARARSDAFAAAAWANHDGRGGHDDDVQGRVRV